MSAKYLTAAWVCQLPPTPKMLLLALAAEADEAGCCWPRVAFLADRVGVLPITVHQAIARLELEGVLQVQRRRGLASIYRLNLEVST